MISIENLGFAYNGSKKQALHNVNLKIDDGDFVGVIGASGAGKTTLSCAINGIIPHHYKGDYYGKVVVNGHDVFDTDPCTLALEVGSVFQDVDSQITCPVVEDEILFGLENFGVPKDEIQKRVDWALKETGIENLRDRDISSLSGGQKQKTAIAAILALRPKILVLDEPTGELDPVASRNVFRILKDLNTTYGMTIIVIEQKIMLLCEFAKNLVVMNEGSVVYSGSVRDILRHSKELLEIGVNCPRVVTYYDELADRKLIDRSKTNVCINVAEAVSLTKKIVHESETVEQEAVPFANKNVVETVAANEVPVEGDKND